MSLIIGCNADFEIDFRLMNGFTRTLTKSQLFAGVCCIGDQFTNENFFIGVKRMYHDIQQLLDFCLKRVLFGLLTHEK